MKAGLLKKTWIKKFLIWGLMGVLGCLVAIIFFITPLLNFAVPYADSYLQKNFGITLSLAKLHVSLISGKISIDGLRLSNGDHASVVIKKVSATIKLGDLLRKELRIEKLKVTGVSVTDGHLLAQHFSRKTDSSVLNGTSSKPGAFRVSLGTGSIEISDLTEHLGEKTLFATGVKLLAQEAGADTYPNTYRLLPSVESIDGVLGKSAAPLHLGEFTGEILAGPAEITVSSFSYTNGASFLNAAGTSSTDSLAAKINYNFDSRSFNLESVLDTALHGTITLGGTARTPRFTAQGSSESGRSVALPVADENSYRSICTVDNFEFESSGEYAAERTKFTLSKFALKGNSCSATLKTPLTFIQETAPHLPAEELGGVLELRLAPRTIAGLDVGAVTAALSVSGDSKAPRVTAALHTDKVVRGNLQTGPIELTGVWSGDKVSVTAHEQSDTFGSAVADAEIALRPTSSIISSKIRLTNVKPTSNVDISGSISAQGAPDLQKLSAQSNLSVLLKTPGVPEEPVLIDVAIENGLLTASLSQSDKIKGVLSASTAAPYPAGISLNLLEQDLPTLASALRCHTKPIALSANVDLSQPLGGKGEFNLSEISCLAGDKNIVVSATKPLKIEGGTATLDGLSVTSGPAKLDFHGSVSAEKLDVSASGDLSLKEFSQFIPEFEEVTGTASVALKASGSLQTPVLQGTAAIKNLGGFIDSAGVALRDVSGDILLTPERIQVKSVTGKANHGEFNLAGSLEHFDPRTANATLSFKELAISPGADGDLTLSGDLALTFISQNNQQVPELSGNIELLDGLFEKKIKLKNIAQMIDALFKPKSARTVVAAQQTASASPLAFDIHLTSAGGLQVVTNLGEIEAGSDLSVHGLANDLTIEGEVPLISGWFGIQSTHFDISSGVISFVPDSKIPILNIRGEHEQPTTDGDPITIYCDITGLASNPVIRFSSDTGLSHEEALKLLTQGGGSLAQEAFDTLAGQLGIDSLEFSDEDSFLSRFVKVDSVKIDTNFDVDTNAVQSRAVAQKDLSRALSLTSSIPLGGQTDSQAQAAVKYQLSRTTGLIGTFNLPSTSEKQSFAVDFGVDLIPAEKPLTIKMYGLHSYRQDTLLTYLHLSERRWLSETQVPLIETKTKRFLRERGFLSAEVHVICLNRCRRIEFHLKEGPRPKISTVIFEGLESDPELAKKLSAQESLPKTFATKGVLRNKARDIRQEIRKVGYLSSRVDGRYELSSSGEMTLTLHVFLRKKLSIEIKNSPDRSIEQIFDELQVYSRRIPYGSKLPDEVRQSLITHYRNQGFSEVSAVLERSTDPASGATATTITVDRGSKIHAATEVSESESAETIAVPTKAVKVKHLPVTILDIQITGNSRIKTETILKNLKITSGEQWSDELITAARIRLFKLGLFAQVSLKPKDGKLDGPTEILLVSVKEKSLREVRIGTGYDSTFGVHLFGNAIDKTFFGDGREVSFKADFYYDLASQEIGKSLLSGRFIDPFVLDSDWRWSEELGYKKLTSSTQSFDLDRGYLSSLFTYPLTTNSQLALGHTFLQDKNSDVPADVILSRFDDNTLALSFLNARIAYDSRDDLLLPTKGFVFSLDGKVALSEIGSNAAFWMIEPKTAAVLPLSFFSPRLSLGLSAQFGIAQSLSNTDEIPLSQRFFLGGQSTVRGYKENSLGPRGSLGNPIGGDSSASGSAELRYLLADRIVGLGFFDSGNVYLRNHNDDDSALRSGTGIGLRYLSPIGAVGFDVATPLNPQEDDKNLRFYISVGGSL